MTAWRGFVGHRLSSEPKVVVQGAVLSDEGVLLAVRVDLRGWELPGGSPDPGESDAEALAREVLEETGVSVRVERKVGDYHRTGFLPHVARVYRCRALHGTPQPSEESVAVAWWDPKQPPASLLPNYRAPLADAAADLPEPVVRHERQGWRQIWESLLIDLSMRFGRGPERGALGAGPERGA